MKKEYLILGAVGVGALCVGAFGGYYFGKQAGGSICEVEKQEMQRQADEFRTSVEAAFPEPEQVFDLTGVIKGIEGNDITIEVPAISPLSQIFSESTTETRHVLIDDTTVLVEVEYVESSTGGGIEKEKEISLDSLEVGQFITVSSRENIKDAESFGVYRVETFTMPVNLDDTD